MTTQATPKENPATYLSEQDIRIWMRDKDPAANLLLQDLEFTPEEIRTAATLAVDVYNDTVPAVSSWTVDSFPFRSSLLNGTAANLLFIAANRYRRNKLTYNIPGGSVSDQDKAADYDTAGGRLMEVYKAWCSQHKRSVNIMSGWATV